MKYIVKKITKDSNHDAVRHLEDDEMIIVENLNGDYWEASEFFHMTDVKEFVVTERGKR